MISQDDERDFVEGAAVRFLLSSLNVFVEETALRGPAGKGRLTLRSANAEA